MLQSTQKEHSVSQPIFVLALASTVKSLPVKATMAKLNEWKKYWPVTLSRILDYNMILNLTPKKFICNLKSDAPFTLLLFPSFDHRFPKCFSQCKSKRHRNSISYLPVLLINNVNCYHISKLIKAETLRLARFSKDPY